MATTDVVPQESAGGTGHKSIVNDMSIQVATVNGSGSQSSNTVLLRSIFQMGVPVSGKNMFPSNIAGLPTWYTIRANKNGYIGRKKEIDFLVAMNPETAQEDTLSLAPGASVLYDEPLALHKLRNDLVFYAVPYDKIVAAVCPEAKLRKLVKNMVYVGVVANLLEIEMGEVEKAIRKHFAKKVKAANLNLAAFTFFANCLRIAFSTSPISISSRFATTPTYTMFLTSLRSLASGQTAATILS